MVVGIERLGGGSNTTFGHISFRTRKLHDTLEQQHTNLPPCTHTTTLLGVLQHVFINKNKGLSYCAVPITQQSHHMSPSMVT